MRRAKAAAACALLFFSPAAEATLLSAHSHAHAPAASAMQLAGVHGALDNVTTALGLLMLEDGRLVIVGTGLGMLCLDSPAGGTKRAASVIGGLLRKVCRLVRAFPVACHHILWRRMRPPNTVRAALLPTCRRS